MESLFINDIDASTWGINLEDGALSTLMAPAPQKSIAMSNCRLEAGKRVVNAPQIDARDITLQLHLLASSRSEFWSRYRAFCNDVLYTGKVDIWTSYNLNEEYHCLYVSCTQFQNFMFGIGKFSLKLTEFNPSAREPTSQHKRMGNKWVVVASHPSVTPGEKTGGDLELMGNNTK